MSPLSLMRMRSPVLTPRRRAVQYVAAIVGQVIGTVLGSLLLR